VGRHMPHARRQADRRHDAHGAVQICEVEGRQIGGNMGYWDDYIMKRPGTVGGEQAIFENIRAQADIVPRPRTPEVPEFPDLPQAPAIPRRPRVKRQLTKIDFIIGGVVFIVTWMMLASSSNMDTGGAVTVAFFASAIAGMWWRSLVLIAVVVVVLIFLVSVMK
jgi:hypothetical protein